MSEESSHHREWAMYLRDMLEFAEKVLAYTSGFDQETLLADDRTYDATLRNLELIGEAATHIPIDVREAHSEIPWRAIRGRGLCRSAWAARERSEQERKTPPRDARVGHPFALALG